MTTNSKAGMEAIGFLTLGAGLLAAYSAFKNRSLKAVLINSINPKAGLTTTLGPTTYGVDSILGGASSLPEAGSNTSFGTARGNQVVAFAMAQVGKPYLWGGIGIGGFDCSGLTMEAYKSVSYILPRVAQAQYEATKQWAIPTPSAGDLVFFGTRTNIYHVGIALGNGQMVDAPHTGAPVRVESYQTGWDLFAATSPLGATPLAATPGPEGT